MTFIQNKTSAGLLAAAALLTLSVSTTAAFCASPNEAAQVDVQHMSGAGRDIKKS
jgi:hypothetical protein